MKTNSPLQPACVAVCILGVASAASADTADELGLDRNRLSIGARFGFNISAKVSNLPVAASAAPNYDDGFVRTDISGNAGGKTTYWGYDQAGQLVGTDLELHSAPSPRDGTDNTLKDDPHAGFEITYGRELTRFTLGKGREVAVGVELGFGSMDLNFSGSDAITGNVLRTTDRYSVTGIVPPLPPYAGTYAGPGPLIDAAPNSSSTAVAAVTSTMSSKVDALVYGLKLGPFMEVPIIKKRLALQLSAGVAAVNAEGDFAYNETFSVAAAGGPPQARIDKFSGSAWLIGFYGNCNLAFSLNDTMSVFAGGQYQNLGDMTIEGGGKAATINMGQDLEGVIGLRFTF